MNIVLLGPPGVGKGTQGKRLAAELEVPHIASGDLFRAMRDNNTPLAREVREYMDRGEYVPDNLTIEVVLARLGRSDAAQGFVLDGFPRTSPQADALDEALNKKGQKVDYAIYITAPVEVLVKRIAGRMVCPNCGAIYNMETNPPKNDRICDVCGHYVERRSDEDPEVVRTRLQTYMNQTAPIVEHYRRQGNLIELDGSLSIDAVQQELDRGLGLRSPS